MKHNLTIYKDISRLCTVTFVYVLIFITFLTIYEGSIVAPYYLLGIPVILGCYQMIQRYCYQPILYLLLHGICYIPLWVVPFPTKCYWYLYLFLLIYETFHAITIWKYNVEKPYTEAPWHMFLFATILYIIAIADHKEQLAQAVYYIGLALLLLHFIRYFLNGASNLITQSEHATTMPTKKIMLTNIIILSFFLITFLCVTLLTHTLQLDNFIYTIGDFIISVIGVAIQLAIYIITILRAIFATDSTKDTRTDETANLEEALYEITEPSLFAQIISGLIEITVILFLVYFLYKVFVSLVKMMLHRYAKDSDIILALHQKKEKTTPQQEKESILNKVTNWFDADNRAKVRRTYRLKIRNYKEYVVQESDTPTDIANNILNQYEDDLSTLTNIYEKARYSAEEITTTDLEHVRKSL